MGEMTSLERVQAVLNGRVPDRVPVIPQSFLFSLAYDAYEQLMKEQEINVTDDAMVVGLYHEIPIQMVRGSYTNMKVTTPEDLVLAEAFLLHRNVSGE